MDLLQNHLLSLVIFLPLAAALVALVMPKEEPGQIRTVGFLASLATFFLSLLLVPRFDTAAGGMQLQERMSWVEGLGLSYHVGVDGIALLLILLTTFLSPIILLSVWSITLRVKELVIALLVLQTAMVGAFAALDLVLFFVFWELMLVPMYLLIGIWGSERRVYAALKFFLYTTVGSMVMLVGILYLYWQTRDLPGVAGATFAYGEILRVPLSNTEQRWLFWAFALAFAIKVPIFPLHTWLPDAHVQAPAAGSVVLAGVLLKMGTFGFVRYAMPLFPEATEAYAPVIGWLGVIGIVYGSFMSLAQGDMKKLIAYSSVAHLGFVMMGLMARTEQGVAGAVLQMVNHGISTGALFLLVGYMYDRRHTRDISAYGGQAKATPVMAAIFLVVTLSSIGLPGTNGFVGEFLILAGTFTAAPTYARWWGVIGATGVVLGAVYMLTLYQRVYLGPITRPEVAHTKDLNGRELTTLVPLLALIVILGVFPQPFLELIRVPVNAIARAEVSASPYAGQGRRAPARDARRVEPSRPGAPAVFPRPFGDENLRLLRRPVPAPTPSPDR